MTVDQQTRTSDWVPTLKGVAIDAVPESVDVAVDEQTRLLDDLRNIDGQLGQAYIERDGRRLGQREYAEWRRKALVARRLTEGRYRFVKKWINQNGSGRPSLVNRDDMGVAATTQARNLTKRVSAIEAIALAAVVYVREQTTENFNELVLRVNENAGRGGVDFSS